MSSATLTAEQFHVIARWAEPGISYVPVELLTSQPAFVREWTRGDVLAIQGDAHLHVDAHGRVRDVVPPAMDIWPAA